MAMRFGHRICSNVRINKFSGVPTSLRGRSYCSEALSQLPASSTAFAIAKVASPWAIWGGWFYYYDFLGFRTMIENWMAERKVQEMLERLNREKLKSEDAYVEMLDREANAVKKKLSKREIGFWDANFYHCEIAALKLLLEETRPDKESNTPQAA